MSGFMRPAAMLSVPGVSPGERLGPCHAGTARGKLRSPSPDGAGHATVTIGRQDSGQYANQWTQPPGPAPGASLGAAARALKCLRSRLSCQLGV